MGNWTEETIQKVWEKAKVDSSRDSNIWRKDQCDAWIRRYDYGKRDSLYGWEIDHIKCVANGGGNELSNLRPLHWRNNASRQDGRLVCRVPSKRN